MTKEKEDDIPAINSFARVDKQEKLQLLVVTGLSPSKWSMRDTKFKMNPRKNKFTK